MEGVRGFIPASKLALNYVEDTEEYLNKPLQVQVIDVDKEKKRLVLSAKELLREKAEKERRNKISNIEVGFVTEEPLRACSLMVRLLILETEFPVWFIFPRSAKKN